MALTQSLRLVPLLTVISLISGAAPVANVQVPTMKGYPAVGAPPLVKVLARGGTPRIPLRYVMPVGQKSSLQLQISGSMVTKLGALYEPQPMPTLNMTVNVEVTGVAPNGDISCDLAIVDLTMDAIGDVNPANATLQRIIAAVKASKATARVSNRGVANTTFLIEPPLEAVVAQWTSSLEHLWTPLPEEAVGVGARWEVRQATKTMGGLTAAFYPTVFRRTEYEIVSIDGSTLSLRMKSEEIGPPQIARTPLSSTEMNVEKLAGASIGAVTLDLVTLAPFSEITSTTATSGFFDNPNLKGAPATFYGRAKVAIVPSRATRSPDALTDLRSLRGIKTVNLGGSFNSTVGPDRVCYPRPADDGRGTRAGVSIALGGLLQAATVVLKAGEIDVAPSTDFLNIDAQVWDGPSCKATITLELNRGRGAATPVKLPNGGVVTSFLPTPVIWRRTFELSGAPAGFSARVVDRFSRDVREFVEDVARARRSKPPEF